MAWMKVVIVVLVIALFTESVVLVSMYRTTIAPTATPSQAVQVLKGSYVPSFDIFNQPQSNDTEYSLNESLNGSWVISIDSHLSASAIDSAGSEAQVAIAPEYPTENVSIPTIIVQMRSDGLLRVEYYAQNWKNTYGLVLYNATTTGWQTGENITLGFFSYGAPSPINPQTAPYPNGNLTVSVGGTIVVNNYPIAWANLADFYLYGLPGSRFIGGAVSIAVYEVSYVD